MPRYEIHSCEQMMELIQQLGFLPLLASGISGYSPEESYRLMTEHLHATIPYASDKQISKLLR